MAPPSTGTSPSATRSPRASATPTRPAPTGCAAGPTGSPRCSPTRGPATSATPTSRSAAASCDAILAEQLEPALALRPDLVTIYAGANDILRPRVDIDALVAAYDEAVGRLAATGAHGRAVHRLRPRRLGRSTGRLRGRFALYNEVVREIAERHGAALVDFWRMREYRDCGSGTPTGCTWPAGHQRMAIAVLDALGVAHDARAAGSRRCPSWTAGSAATPTSPGPGRTQPRGCTAG